MIGSPNATVYLFLGVGLTLGLGLGRGLTSRWLCEEVVGVGSGLLRFPIMTLVREPGMGPGLRTRVGAPKGGEDGMEGNPEIAELRLSGSGEVAPVDDGDTASSVPGGRGA